MLDLAPDPHVGDLAMELLPRFLWYLWHHARHIERYDSIHHSPNTHLTGEALGLLYVGLLFLEFRRSARWAATGGQLLVSELEYQVLNDGMHFERATGYHRYTVEIYTHGAAWSRAVVGCRLSWSVG